ncbi:hypothetical protein BASA61_009954 [Batrachochytrium salamandrivorans]|nr:hypothetical protein BASA62_009642 [Batrachochytrium salamandrivorans]KAH6579966.1 hypothetical protein BASA61_009954 [Batrachochytrium salamandrivorans]
MDLHIQKTSRQPRIVGTTGSRFATLDSTSKIVVDPLAATHQPNYFKALQWSPDGQVILTNSYDSTMRLFDTAMALSIDPDISQPTDLVESVCIRSGEPIYDMKWYPFMSSSDPATCCFISCSRDHPVQLWDAYSGQLRGTYMTKDHVDQVSAPISLAFNLDGSKIFCGLEGRLQIFDTGRPGTDSEVVALTPCRRSSDGQKGLVSSIAFSPDQSGLLGVGTYSGQVGLYDSTTHGCVQLLEPSWRHGVTQVQFSTTTATTLLFAASRLASAIECWDLRMLGRAPLGRFSLCGATQQRLAFDVTSAGSKMYLVSGDRVGDVRVYDVMTALDVAAAEVGEDSDAVLVMDTPWCQVSGASCAAVSSTQFHPYAPFVAMCCGERRLASAVEESDSEVDNDDDDDHHLASSTIGDSASAKATKPMDCRLAIFKWDQLTQP